MRVRRTLETGEKVNGTERAAGSKKVHPHFARYAAMFQAPIKLKPPRHEFNLKSLPSSVDAR